MNATVLITGGAGYIGASVAWACLDRGHSVIIVDNLSTGVRGAVPPGARFVEGDVGDRALMRGLVGEADAVMHFAGSTVVPDSVVQPNRYYANNVVNSLALIDAVCAAGPKPFIFSSTAAVYAPSESAVRETAPLAPLSPYGRSKLMTETMLADAAAAYGLRYAALRYFNVAGADPDLRSGQSTPRATHLIKVACEAAVGLREVLPIYGRTHATPDGTCVRDYIHVSDLADAHVLALDHLMAGKPSVVMNCGYGRGASVLDVIAALERVLGRALPIQDAPARAGDAARAVSDPSLLRATLPWAPRFDDLETIVASALAWERHMLAQRG